MIPERCATCGYNPLVRMSSIAECSHVECPHRRQCWSEREPVMPHAPSDPLNYDEAGREMDGIDALRLLDGA